VSDRLRVDDPAALAAAERIIRVITALRIRNELWAEEGPAAELPARVLENPDVADYDLLNDNCAVIYKHSPLERLVAQVIAEEVNRS
jgi:hypothetical protein